MAIKNKFNIIFLQKLYAQTAEGKASHITTEFGQTCNKDFNALNKYNLLNTNGTNDGNALYLITFTFFIENSIGLSDIDGAKMKNYIRPPKFPFPFQFLICIHHCIDCIFYKNN